MSIETINRAVNWKEKWEKLWGATGFKRSHLYSNFKIRKETTLFLCWIPAGVSVSLSAMSVACQRQMEQSKNLE